MARHRCQDFSPPVYPPHAIKDADAAQVDVVSTLPATGDPSQLYLYHDDNGHRREVQISFHSARLPALQDWCRRKNRFRQQGRLQGRLRLCVLPRSEEENRRLWKQLGSCSIHSDHRGLRSTSNLRFFDELSIECVDEGNAPQLVEDGTTCHLLLSPTLFEECFAFLCRYAEGYWAYRLDLTDELLLSTHLLSPTPEQDERWNWDI